MAESIEDLQAQFKDAFDLARQRVMERLASANAITEREVLAIGERLHQLVSLATKDEEAITDGLAALDETNDTSAGAAVKRQGEATTAFARDISTFVDAQVAAAKAAVNASAAIDEAGRQVERITVESRILAVNTRIQASRMKDGTRFAAIAQEMRRLSELIEGANHVIRDLADQLQRSLPVLMDRAEAMNARSAAFSDELEGNLDEVSRRTEELREHLRLSIDEGEARRSRVLQLSQDTLSHLGFQDPQAQELLRAERDLNLVHDLVLGALRGDGEVAERVFSQHAGSDTENTEHQAGEVLLF